MDQLIEKIAKAPVATKAAAVLGAVILITLVNYFAFGVPAMASISDLQTKITRTENEQKRLNSEYIEKQAIANDLNRFRREGELLEQRLQEALAELPEDKNLAELLQSFQDKAQKAGLEIATIVPGAAAPEQFYIRIPIDMKVTGSFHEIASFLDAVGHLTRIVNVSDITMDTPKDTGGKIVLNTSFTATTFMFADSKKGAAQ